MSPVFCVPAMLLAVSKGNSGAHLGPEFGRPHISEPSGAVQTGSSCHPQATLFCGGFVGSSVPTVADESGMLWLLFA